MPPFIFVEIMLAEIMLAEIILVEIPQVAQKSFVNPHRVEGARYCAG